MRVSTRPAALILVAALASGPALAGAPDSPATPRCRLDATLASSVERVVRRLDADLVFALAPSPKPVDLTIELIRDASAGDVDKNGCLPREALVELGNYTSSPDLLTITGVCEFRHSGLLRCSADALARAGERAFPFIFAHELAHLQRKHVSAFTSARAA